MDLKPKLRTILTCGILGYLLVAQTVWAQTSKTKENLQRIFAGYHEEEQKLYPLVSTFQGEGKYNNLLPADDVHYLKLIHDFNKKYLNRISTLDFNALNKSDQVSYQILKIELESALRMEQFHNEYLPINQLSSVPSALAILASGKSAQPFNTVKDYKNWIERCGALPYWTDVAIENMRKGIEAGIVLPKAVVLKMIPQLEKLSSTDSSKSIFYSPLKIFPVSFTSGQKKQITRNYRKVIDQKIVPSYQKLLVFIQEEYLPKSRTSSGINALPNGDAFYREMIYQNTSFHKTPEEIYQIGISEVARITMKMESIKDSIGFKGSLQDLFGFMRTNPEFMPFKTKEEVIQYYNNIYEKIKPHLSTYFGLVPKTPFEIRAIEDFRAATAPPQYFPGSIEKRRPGIFYIPIPDPAKINVTGWEAGSVFLHEAIPGHHYQTSLQSENDNFPKFRKNYSRNAFCEGWALYVESLGKDLGVLTDPYHQLGALGSEIHRAVRLVADVAIHTGKMTREEAIKYMLEHQSISENDAIVEIERYMVWPGQALSYKSGELKIKELRDKYRNQLGDKFKIVEFHDAVLLGGNMPLDVFENYMDDWATNVK